MKRIIYILLFFLSSCSIEKGIIYTGGEYGRCLNTNQSIRITHTNMYGNDCGFNVPIKVDSGFYHTEHIGIGTIPPSFKMRVYDSPEDSISLSKIHIYTRDSTSHLGIIDEFSGTSLCVARYSGDTLFESQSGKIDTIVLVYPHGGKESIRIDRDFDYYYIGKAPTP
jgi:hypothetical protein